MVVDDDASVAVENSAAWGWYGKLLDSIALSGFAVNFRLLDLQLPEPGDQEEKDPDRKVLKSRHFTGGETGIVTGKVRMVDFMLKFWIENAVHGRRNYPVLLYCSW